MNNVKLLLLLVYSVLSTGVLASNPAVFLFQQEIEISGKVASADGQGIPNVSVRTKRAQSVSAGTDAEGSYKIKALSSDTLVFSYVGFEPQEIPVSGQKKIDVVLVELVNLMDDVVIVAYGSQKKITLTGAISSISTRELRQSPVSNLSNALAGRLPGLAAFQPSGEPGNDLSQLFIRGVSTFNNASPLVVVDGVLGRDFAQLDPNEVESISILKDASSTAVYGVRGANGVILVTTRRGKSGQPQITFSSELGYQSPIRLPKFLDSYNYAKLYNEALTNDMLPKRFSDQDIEYYRIGADPFLYPNTDWFGEFLKPFTPMSRTNLNIGGGGDKVRYFVSASAMTQDGMYNFTDLNEYETNAKFNRYNFRSNIDVDLNKNFTIGLDLAGRVENRNYPGRDSWLIFTILNRIPPTFPIRNENGSLAGNGPNNESPLGLIAYGGYQNLYGNFLQGTYKMNHKLNFITQGLSARAAFSFDGAFDYNISASRGYAVYQLREDGGYNQFGNDTELGLGKGYTYNRTVNIEGALDYSRSFSNHDVSGLLLYNLNKRVVHDDGYNIPFSYLGFVSRVTYGYDNRLFGEVNIGYNGSEQFPKGKRFGFFPSFSGGWVISREGFFNQEQQVINLLKLRASYGEVGNDRLGARRFLYQQTFQGAEGYRFGSGQVGYGGIAEGALANMDITWERARKINVGLELGMWKDKLALTADVFHEKRDNILTTRGTISSILGHSGGNLPPANVGVVQNRGFDLELTHRNSTDKKFNYSVSGNMTFARNEVQFMDEERREYDYQYRTGHRVGQPFGLESIGFFESYEDIQNSPAHAFVTQESLRPGDIKYRDVNNDGIVDGNDEVPIGYNTGIPELMFGFSTRLSYKGVDFSFLFQGAGNSSVFMDNFAIWEFRGGGAGKVNEWHMDRWTPETASTATYPRLSSADNQNNHRLSTFWMRPRNYVRLKNIELGYSFSANALRYLKINKVRAYVNAHNLFTWDNVKIVDPEAPAWSGNHNYPQQRVINGGITVDF
jgi:TonB-linked SusC/RagA family outer membrane protein